MQKETGKHTQITGIHIDIPDGPLKLRIGGIAPAGWVEAKWIPAETLKDHNGKEERNARGCGEQDGFQLDAGKKETKEKKEITELCCQTFAANGGAKPPGLRTVRAEKTAEDGPEKQHTPEDQRKARDLCKRSEESAA